MARRIESPYCRMIGAEGRVESKAEGMGFCRNGHRRHWREFCRPVWAIGAEGSFSEHPGYEACRGFLARLRLELLRVLQSNWLSGEAVEWNYARGEDYQDLFACCRWA